MDNSKPKVIVTKIQLKIICALVRHELMHIIDIPYCQVLPVVVNVINVCNR